LAHLPADIAEEGFVEIDMTLMRRAPVAGEMPVWVKNAVALCLRQRGEGEYGVRSALGSSRMSDSARRSTCVSDTLQRNVLR
jgi:hypothetical protein